MIQLQQLSQHTLNQTDLEQSNAHALNLEIAWFESVLDMRFQYYFEKDRHLDIDSLPPPDMSGLEAIYARFITQNNITSIQRLCLILAMLPHIKPDSLDTLLIKSKQLDKPYTEFGGAVGKSHRGFLPTIETLLFISSGKELVTRFSHLQMFDEDALLMKNKIIQLGLNESMEPYNSALISLNKEYLKAFTTGIFHKPDFNSAFPAKLLTSELEWKDLVLAPSVMDEVEQVLAWCENSETIMSSWGFSKHLKKGYRALFYGPPGTGKSLTATLIGKHVGMDVYHIDLSSVVSKYIGETEKNLAGIFDQAENKQWILFFEEADALFGSRTQTSNSKDRHANQGVSYLLQRIEDFAGIVILASNLKDNIDEAFTRRFQSTIYFSMPTAIQRESLLRSMLIDKAPLADDVDLHQLSADYEVSGGAMTNVIRNAALLALRGKRSEITQLDLKQSYQKELRKQGKSIS
ncbi:ATP-binding protein [Glaciecola sp. XM2]|uniref:ATP-binding protein n=1 Tax=Glaciecola sp. XM2 TaxID=1914931 RepID=UPI001BDEEE64|nr:ATP-binding protein [Glaciecola sp. XM2]MBT1450220.1 ATP-binding protein [Glaciecola sp. XM2]